MATLGPEASLPPSRQLVIRADASPVIGGGHVQRCSTLAVYLASRGWRCALAGRTGSDQVVPFADGIEFLALDSTEADELAALRRRWPDGIELLIVDHYALAAPWEAECRAWARHIIVIDDLANRPHACDLLLDQTIAHDEAAYRRLVPADCRLLLGPRFALLRPEFQCLRGEALRRRQAPGRHLLINFGAVDPLGIGGQILMVLADSGRAFDLDLVCGADTPQTESLRALASRMSGNVLVHGRVEQMADLMLRADLAIGAGGSASWERCALSLPSLLLVLSGDQAPIVDALAKAGAAVNLGLFDPDSVQAVVRRTVSLLNDPALRITMASRAATICDAMGAERVVESIEQLVNEGIGHHG